MNLFSMIQMQYDKFDKAVRDYLAKALNNVSYKYTNSSIFGQLMTVVSAAIQNILSYVEDRYDYVIIDNSPSRNALLNMSYVA